jgi:uncharacterized protein
MKMQSTGGLLRGARLGQGLTQAALAERAGTSQAAVARYEAGVVSPAVSTLQRLFKACGRDLVLDIVETPHTADLSSDQARLLRRRRGDILKACSRHGARNVRIFGSVARGQARPGSDIDVLCDLDPDRDLVDLAALRAELTEILGVPVDVSTPRLLKPAILAAALREAVPL